MAVRLNPRTEPTRRTLAKLEAEGWLADEVERKQGKISRDCYGFADVLAIRAHPLDERMTEVLLVQVTSDNGGNVAKRMGKVQASDRAWKLYAAGVTIQVWGWRPDRLEPRILELIPF